MRLRKHRSPPPVHQGLRSRMVPEMHPKGLVVLNAAVPDQTNADNKPSMENTAPLVTTTTTYQLEPHLPAEPPTEVKGKEATQLLEAGDEICYQQTHWTNNEALVLLEAKRKEQDMFSGSRRSVLTADDKWKFVSDFCKTKNVLRSKQQCRLMWEDMLLDYRKVREYEEQKQRGSYFDMEVCDRKAKLLPPDMNLDAYQQIDVIMSSRPMKGGLSGLKREAREKRFVDINATRPVERLVDITPTKQMEAVKQTADLSILSGMKAVGTIHAENGGKFEGTLARAQETCGRSDISEMETTGAAFEAGRKRKKKTLETTAEDFCQNEIRNNSSTEEDGMTAGRPEGPVSDGLFIRDKNVSRVQVVRMNSDIDTAYCQNPGGSISALREEIGGAQSEFSNDRRSFQERETDFLAYIESRKDARHKELLALEREKIAVLRDASVTIANALNDAISVFSNIAKELLQHR